jgi:hypothetical protein
LSRPILDLEQVKKKSIQNTNPIIKKKIPTQTGSGVATLPVHITENKDGLRYFVKSKNLHAVDLGR